MSRHARHRHAAARTPAPVLLLLASACTVQTDDLVTSPPADLPRLSVAESSVVEGDSGAVDLTFEVSLDKAAEQTVTADYSTVDGTAAAGLDFFGRTGELVIEVGQRTTTVTVPVVGDVVREGDEEFRLQLSNAVGAQLEVASARAMIMDDDAFPRLEVVNATVNEADAGVTPLSFLITLTAVPDAPVTVDWQTSPGTASPDSDYVAAEGTLTFDTGVRSQTITVAVLDDDFEEPTESLLIVFSNAVNAILPLSPGTGTIEDDDLGGSGVGLTVRPDNATCLAGPAPVSSTEVVLADAFPTLPAFAAPIQLGQAPGDELRWFVAERAGRLLRYDPQALPPPDPDPVPEPDPDALPVGLTAFLDITAAVAADGEGGLLGFAFHPDFADNGHVFVSYTRPGAPLTSVIARFTSLDGGVTLDPTSERVLLSVDQPFGNHNGGRIGFGPDGLLYIAMGDGGGAGDPGDNAQNTRNLLGAMLRIDVDNGDPYAIPASNPFEGNPFCNDGGIGADDCPEIFAWGLRNPWQWQFDAGTGALWAGDVGQNAREEIDVIVAGGNYGWRVREATQCFDPPVDCSDVGFVAPVADYSHTSGLGSSVTGGYVYRGTAIPTLVGRYVFADFASGRVMALTTADDAGYTIETLIDSALSPVSFYADAAGELYVTDIAGGRFYAVRPGTASESNAFPDSLADTGCVDPATPGEFADGVIPYATLVPGFTDGATHTKGFAIPDGTRIDTGLGDGGDGDFTLPDSFVALQHLTLGGTLVETRVLAKHADGRLRGYSYAWNAEGTEATRVRGGQLVNLGEAEMLDGPLWYHPSERECLACHLGPAGETLGLEVAQLNALYTYGTRRTNQLTTLDGIGMFDEPLPAAASDLPAFPRLADDEQTLTSRARAWLHVNCAGCHQPGGNAPGSLDLRFERTIDETSACDIAPGRGDLGITDARIIAPGEPGASVLSRRLRSLGPERMPPAGTRTTDAAGIALVDAWISAMEPDCLVTDEADVGIDPVPPPDDPPPPDDDAASIAAFETTLYPLLRTNCAACHGGGGPGNPAFAHPLVATAHAATVDNMLVDLADPAASRLVDRLAVDRHQCFSGDCAADAAAVQAQIEAWAQALAEPPPPPDPTP